MGYIKTEDIAGIRFSDGTVVCSECATEEEAEKATEGEIITRDMVEDDEGECYCDRCKKNLCEKL